MRSSYTTIDGIDVELDGIERDEHHNWTAANVYGHRECCARPGELLGRIERVRTRFRATVNDRASIEDTFRSFDHALFALVFDAYTTPRRTPA